MKYLVSLLVVCLGAGCATRKDSQPKAATVVPDTSVPAKRMAAIRTPEIVKAYPAGRYTDPNYPDEMHERHTVYRREQAPDWNYLPDPPPMLPTGNLVGSGSGQSDARQQVYAEALQEQNRAMRKRIEELQQQAGKVQGLEQEIDRLKDQIDANPKPPVAPTDPKPTQTAEDELFSSVEPELPVWEEGGAEFPDSDALLSQMRANDQISAELAAAERQRISAVLTGPFLRRKEFVLLNH